MKKIIFIFMLSLIWMLSACSKKENVEEKIEPLEASEELFLYEGTEDAKIIAVDEEGYLSSRQACSR